MSEFTIPTRPSSHSLGVPRLFVGDPGSQTQWRRDSTAAHYPSATNAAGLQTSSQVVALETTLWGYKPRGVADRAGRQGIQGLPGSHQGPMLPPFQPFDRVQPNYEVFENRLTIPATAPPGWYAVIETRWKPRSWNFGGTMGVLCDAALPVAISPRRRLVLGRRRPAVRRYT